MSTEVDHDLRLLCSQVDDWFTDITLDNPICQFSIADSIDEDKLATITKKTFNWFKALENPLTLEGIEDVDLQFYLQEDHLSQVPDDVNLERCNSDTRTRKKKCIRENSVSKPDSRTARSSNGSRKIAKKSSSYIEHKKCQNIDLLVKDLELLLENNGTIVNTDKSNLIKDENKEKETEFYLYNLYDNDEHALLDDSIGNCCIVPMESISTSLKRSNNNQDFTTVTSSHHLLEHDCMPREDEFNNQEHDVDLKQKLLTPMPLDHDYLPRLKPRPSTMNNKLIKSVRHKQLESTSVLNTGVIKRFAKFSSQFRVLRDKHEKLMAIENN